MSNLPPLDAAARAEDTALMDSSKYTAPSGRATLGTSSTEGSFRTLGGGGDQVKMLQGFDGLLSHYEVVIMETSRLVNDVMTISERTSRFLDSALDRSERLVQVLNEVDAIGAVSTATVRQTPTAAGTDGTTGITKPEEQAEAQRQYHRHPLAPPEWEMEEDPRAAALAAQRRARGLQAPESVLKNPLGFDDLLGIRDNRLADPEETYHIARSRSMQDVRESVGASIGQRMMQWNVGRNVILDEAADRFRDAETGQFVNNREAIKNAVLERVQGVVNNSGSALAEGRGMSGVLGAVGGSTMLKVAGGAGLAVMAGTQAVQFAQNQRMANAEYQSVLGGSNAEGFGERIQEKMFNFQNMGVLGFGQSSQIYKNAMSLYGTDRGGRESYMDTATGLYKDLGMDPAQSHEFLSAAVEQGVEALSTMANAIKGVSAAAREAGTSAETARNLFMTNFSNLADTMPGGSAAMGAQALTTEQLGMGHGYQEVDYGGLGDEVSGLRQARLLQEAHPEGVNIEGTHYNFETAADVYAVGATSTTEGTSLRLEGRQLERQHLMSRLSQIRRIPQEELQRIQNRIDGMSQEEAMRFIEDEAPALASQYDVNPRQVQSDLSRVSITSDVDNAIPVGIYEAVGGPNLTEAYSEAVGEIQQQDTLFRSDESRSFNYGNDIMHGRESDIAEQIGGVAEELGFDRFRDFPTNEGMRLLQRGDFHDGQAGDEERYLASLLRGGHRNPVVERLLSDDDYSTDRRFGVQRNGETVQVTLGEAIEHYQDQIQSGEAEITAGDGEGLSVSDYLQIETDPTVDVTSDSGDGDLPGEPLDDDRGGGTVTIEPSDRLVEWLDFMDQGDVDVATARRQGTPPPP